MDPFFAAACTSQKTLCAERVYPAGTAGCAVRSETYIHKKAQPFCEEMPAPGFPGAVFLVKRPPVCYNGEKHTGGETMEEHAVYRVLMVEDDRGIAQAVQTQGEL